MATDGSFVFQRPRAPGSRPQQLDEPGQMLLPAADLLFAQPPPARLAVHQLVERDAEDPAEQGQLFEPRRVLPPLPVAHPLALNPQMAGELLLGPPSPLPRLDDPASGLLDQVLGPGGS